MQGTSRSSPWPAIPVHQGGTQHQVFPRDLHKEKGQMGRANRSGSGKRRLMLLDVHLWMDIAGNYDNGWDIQT